MMRIEKRAGTITNVTALTATASEIELTLNEGLACPPGSFVNFFIHIGDEKVRRAFSVVHADVEKKIVTIAVRHTLGGKVTPEFWKKDIIGRTVEIMGPMGLNTADKLSKPNLFLFAFGIGAGVIKSLAEYARANEHIQNITIVTGSRNEHEIAYKSYFDTLLGSDSRVRIRHVISSPEHANYEYIGYIQDHISSFSFDDADIYMCGQEKACDELKARIDATSPKNVAYFVEGFH